METNPIVLFVLFVVPIIMVTKRLSIDSVTKNIDYLPIFYLTILLKVGCN